MHISRLIKESSLQNKPSDNWQCCVSWNSLCPSSTEMSAVGYDVLNIARSEEPVQLILGYFFSQLLCCGGGGGFLLPKTVTSNTGFCEHSPSVSVSEPNQSAALVLLLILRAIKKNFFAFSETKIELFSFQQLSRWVVLTLMFLFFCFSLPDFVQVLRPLHRTGFWLWLQRWKMLDHKIFHSSGKKYRKPKSWNTGLQWRVGHT